VPKFREFAGDIIFVRSEVSQEALKELDNDNVIMESDDTEPEKENTRESSKQQNRSPNKSKKKKTRSRVTQFLKDMGKKDSASITHVSSRPEEEVYRYPITSGPCCVPGSVGAAFRADVQALIQPEDTVIIKRNFSAFSGTNLLAQLRMKIITELYLVGCITNLSVFATAQEAASHGLILNIVEDCLGYRTQNRHDLAMKTMTEQMGAYTTTSSAILAAFEGPDGETDGAEASTNAKDANDLYGLSAELGQLGLEGKDRASVQSQDMSITELAESLAASSLSAGDSRSPQTSKSASLPPTTSPSTEPQSPLSARNLRTFNSTPDIRSRANVRVRMRKRNEAELPKVPEQPKAAIHAKTLSREDDKAKIIQSILETKGNQKEENIPQEGEGTR
jgi:nicotinamidase-related amidase